MMKNEGAAKAVTKNAALDVSHSLDVTRIEREVKSGSWCGTCEMYVPSRHICEWKILVPVIVGVAVADAVFMYGQSAGLW
jgi:hypothetical protein